MFSRAALLAAVLMVAGCASSIPADALRLEESTLAVRSIQTRTLEAPSETEILAATIAVLQDMEFNVDRIERPLGVITASKVSDADSAEEKVGLFMLDALCVVSMMGGCDNMSTASDDQRITLTMVVLPSLENDDEYNVRVTIQRVVFDKEDRVKALERIDNAETYQEIFDNLTRSLYIEVQES